MLPAHLQEVLDFRWVDVSTPAAYLRYKHIVIMRSYLFIFLYHTVLSSASSPNFGISDDSMLQYQNEYEGVSSTPSEIGYRIESLNPNVELNNSDSSSEDGFLSSPHSPLFSQSSFEGSPIHNYVPVDFSSSSESGDEGNSALGDNSNTDSTPDFFSFDDEDHPQNNLGEDITEMNQSDDSSSSDISGPETRIPDDDDEMFEDNVLSDSDSDDGSNGNNIGEGEGSAIEADSDSEEEEVSDTGENEPQADEDIDIIGGDMSISFGDYYGQYDSDSSS